MVATLKNFLEELHTLCLVRVIVNSDAGVLEAKLHLEKLFYAELPKGKYANLHSEAIEFHLNMDKITDVRFETAEAKRGNFTTYAIRFLDSNDKAQMSVFLQWGKPGEYAEGQVEAWAALKDKYGETWKPEPVESV